MSIAPPPATRPDDDDAPEARGPGRPQDPSKGESILRAAQTLFLERGFDKTSVDAIAEAAQVAKATVYKRFPDKETLLREAISAKCEAFLGNDTVAWRPEQDLAECLKRFARRFLDLVTDPEAIAMHRLMMEEGGAEPGLPVLFFETAIRPTVVKLAACLTHAASEGRLGVVDAEDAAWRFLGMVKCQDHMRAMLGLTPRAAGDVEATIDACVRDFLAANRAR